MPQHYNYKLKILTNILSRSCFSRNVVVWTDVDRLNAPAPCFYAQSLELTFTWKKFHFQFFPLSPSLSLSLCVCVCVSSSPLFLSLFASFHNLNLLDILLHVSFIVVKASRECCHETRNKPVCFKYKITQEI